MQVRHCRLEDIRSFDQLYDELVRQLAFPGHFGRNLDALWDMLCCDIEGPIEIDWPTAAADRAHLGDKFEALRELFNDVVDERDDVTIRLG